MLPLIALVAPLVATAAPADVPFAPSADERLLLAWMPQEVRCADRPVVPQMLRRPLTALVPAGANPRLDAIRYRFRIDADGRPVSIAREGDEFAPWSTDVAPSLAASRFAASAAGHADCTLTYRAVRSTLAQAPVEDLISYSVAPTAGPLPRAGWDRFLPAGSTCYDPHPRPRVRVYPDDARYRGTPGVRDWVLLSYDQDGRGRPRGVRAVTSTRNAGLNAVAARALWQSRFFGGARSGCLQPFSRAAATLAPPPMPAEVPSPCGAPDGWATRPPLTYPDAYRKRAIEGWAVVRFDVAPWGATGNLHVVESQPTADFGAQAVQMLQQARKTASTTGASGCIERVRFAMGPEAASPEDMPPAPPITFR